MTDFIENLNYSHPIELYRNYPNDHRYPKWVYELRNTNSCPLCKSKLECILFESAKVDSEYFAWHMYGCDVCGWWRANEFPNSYFNGYFYVGILHSTSETDPDLITGITRIEENLSTLFAMEPTGFEHFVGKILKEHYDCEVIHVGKSHDGGIDLILVESQQGRMPVQVKRRSSPEAVESVSIVREFRGAMLLKGYNRGIIVTTAHHFSPSAVVASKPQPDHLAPQSIDLVDCRRLLDIMGTLIKRRPNPEFFKQLFRYTLPAEAIKKLRSSKFFKRSFSDE